MTTIPSDVHVPKWAGYQDWRVVRDTWSREYLGAWGDECPSYKPEPTHNEYGEIAP